MSENFKKLSHMLYKCKYVFCPKYLSKISVQSILIITFWRICKAATILDEETPAWDLVVDKEKILKKNK